MKNFKKSIYKIITASGSGTGFKIQGKDFVITNYHVIEGCKTVAVEDDNKDRHLANVIMANPEVDLAFLEVVGLKDSPSDIRLDPEFVVTNHQKVNIAGFPLGLPFAITAGIVSSPNQPMSGRNYVQTDAAVNPGNSGGPMVSDDGRLVAVTTSKFTNADNMGFGIKHSDVAKEINDFSFTDNKYRVKCNSCDTYTAEKSEFCSNCGNNINQTAFEDFEKSHFANFVEESLVKLGTDPVLCRAGRDFWEFHQGSALVRIFIVNNNYLFATSPLNDLPKQNLDALLTYINTNNVAPYMLGIYQNKIYVSYRCHLSDIYSDKKEEIRENLVKLVLKADDLDDFFKDNYGCEMAMEGKDIGVNSYNPELAEVASNLAPAVESVSISPAGVQDFINPMKKGLNNVTTLMAKYDEYEDVDFDKMKNEIDSLYAEMKNAANNADHLSGNDKSIYEEFHFSYKAVLKDMKRMIQGKDTLQSNWSERIEANHHTYEKMLNSYNAFKKESSVS